jgi:hypothetical protein
MRKTLWKNAVIVGSICAAAEAALILLADPGTDRWVLVQSLLFWFGGGLAVFMADSGLGPLLHGVVLTVLLNTPWYIALSIAPGKWAHLPPLVIASVLFGCLIGYLKKKLPRD